MTSNNETVSRQNIWVGNIVKSTAESMTSEGKNPLLPANVDWRRLYSEVIEFPAISQNT